jgi:hypothetical protein
MTPPASASGKFSLSIQAEDEFAVFVGLIRGEATPPVLPVGTGGFQVTITSIEEFALFVALVRHEPLTPFSPLPQLTAQLHTDTEALASAQAASAP